MASNSSVEMVFVNFGEEDEQPQIVPRDPVRAIFVVVGNLIAIGKY
jgi:hypothetical protein